MAYNDYDDQKNEKIPLYSLKKESHPPEQNEQESEYTGWPFKEGVSANIIIKTAMCFTVFWGSVLVATLIIYVSLVRSSLIFGHRHSDENPMVIFCFAIIISGTSCVVFAIWTLIGAIKAKQQRQTNFPRDEIIKQERCKTDDVSENETLKARNLPVYRSVRERSLSEPNIRNKPSVGLRKFKFCISGCDIEKMKRIAENWRLKRIGLPRTTEKEIELSEVKENITEPSSKVKSEVVTEDTSN